MSTEQKQETENMPDVEREDWNIKDITEESTNKPADETLRETLRGDETRGDADQRDVVGGSDSDDTPQGREEAKKDKGEDS